MPRWCSSANHCGLSHEKVRVTKQKYPQTRVQIPVEAPNSFRILSLTLTNKFKKSNNLSLLLRYLSPCGDCRVVKGARFRL